VLAKSNEDNSAQSCLPPLLRWRAVLLGLVLIPPNILWLHSMELVWGTGNPSRLALFFNAAFILLLLALPNLVLRKYWPRWVLRPAELAIIYAMLCLATAIGGEIVWKRS